MFLQKGHLMLQYFFHRQTDKPTHRRSFARALNTPYPGCFREKTDNVLRRNNIIIIVYIKKDFFSFQMEVFMNRVYSNFQLCKVFPTIFFLLFLALFCDILYKYISFLGIIIFLLRWHKNKCLIYPTLYFLFTFPRGYHEGYLSTNYFKTLVAKDALLRIQNLFFITFSCSLFR